MRVALYARVSTRDKDQEPETQLVPLRAWALAGRHTVVGEYVDHASAVAYDRRTAWADVLALAERQAIDAVAVLKLDRAFRSVLDTLQTLTGWKAHNVAFIAITQQIDTASAAGSLLFTVLAAFAEFERAMIKERVREGVSRRASEGKPIGRQVGAKDKTPRRRIGYLQRYERERENARLAKAKKRKLA